MNGSAPEYFWYQYNNVTYYATSSLSVLSDATSANPATVRFKSIVATLTPTSTNSVTSGDATVSFAKGSGSKSPSWTGSSYGVELYSGNTATVSVSSGYKLTSVVIQEYDSNSYSGTFTCNTGNISDLDSNKRITWTASDNSTTSVVLTSNGGSSYAGDIDCKTFTVSYEAL